MQLSHYFIVYTQILMNEINYYQKKKLLDLKAYIYIYILWKALNKYVFIIRMAYY